MNKDVLDKELLQATPQELASLAQTLMGWLCARANDVGAELSESKDDSDRDRANDIFDVVDKIEIATEALDELLEHKEMLTLD